MLKQTQGTVAPAPHVQKLGWGLAIVGAAVVAFATLLPDSDPVVESHLCLVCGSRGGVDVFLNVLLFIPLGAGLALIGARPAHALPAMFLLSALIETAQLGLIPGRDASIGDVVMNTLGGVVGFALGRYARVLFRPSPRRALTLSVGWCIVWLASQTITSYALAPTFPESLYYGEIARQLGHFELFRGRVLRANVGAIGIPDTRFENSHEIRALLSRGGFLEATVVPVGRTHGIAPIIRVADDEQREIILLAQDDDKVLFGVRTGADVLRVRPPLFDLTGGFRIATAAAADTVAITARYFAGAGLLRAEADSARRESKIRVSGSLGWTLLLPFQWFIEGTVGERLLGWIWMGLLLLPLGYWGIAALRPRQKHVVATGFVAALVAIVIGLVMVPGVFGEGVAPLADWIACIVGLLAGVALASNLSAVLSARPLKSP